METNKWKEANIFQNGTDFLYERTASYMNNIALCNDTQKIKYEQLFENIYKYAKILKNMGLSKNDIVGLCIDNSIEGVYLFYALKSIGVTVLGLSIFNNLYKMNRDIEMIKPKIIISEEKYYPLIKEASQKLKLSTILFKEGTFQPILNFKKEKHSIDENTFSKDFISTIIFTGGSTGIHKGVKLNDKGLNAIANSLDNVFVLEPGMTHLGNIPFGHMIFGQFALHYSLSHALTYYITSDSLPNTFLESIIKSKANGAMGGPIHWQNLLNKPNLKPNSIPFLIQAGSGGESLKYAHELMINRCLEYGGSKAKMLNMLGLTEMSGLTHIRDITNNNPGTVGFPLSCIEDIVVDPNTLENINPSSIVTLKEVPTGETGILLTKGESMMLGYYNNPAESSIVFVNDGKNYWYNTGDLVCRINDSKEITFAGRKKRNFVCNYDNIYPEQVEELILSLPEIKEIVVTKVPDDRYQFLPVYHIVLTDENTNKETLLNKMNNLIETTLDSNALPGYIIYYKNELPKKIENKKLDIALMENNGLKLLNENKLTLVRKK